MLPFNKRQRGGDGAVADRPSQRTTTAKGPNPAGSQGPVSSARPGSVRSQPPESAKFLPERERMFERSLSDDEISLLLPQEMSDTTLPSSQPALPQARASESARRSADRVQSARALPTAAAAPLASESPHGFDEDEFATQVFDAKKGNAPAYAAVKRPSVKSTLLARPPTLDDVDVGVDMGTGTDESGSRPPFFDDHDSTRMMASKSVPARNHPPSRRQRQADDAAFAATAPISGDDVDVALRMGAGGRAGSLGGLASARPRSTPPPPAFARSAGALGAVDHSVPHPFASSPMPLSARVPAGPGSAAGMAISLPSAAASDGLRELVSTASGPKKSSRPRRRVGVWAAAFMLVGAATAACVFFTQRNASAMRVVTSLLDPSSASFRSAVASAASGRAGESGAVTASGALQAPQAPLPGTEAPQAMAATPTVGEPAPSTVLVVPVPESPVTTLASPHGAVAGGIAANGPVPHAAAAAAPKPVVVRPAFVPAAPVRVPVAHAPQPALPKEPKAVKKPAGGLSDEDRKAADDAKRLADKQLEQSL